MLNWADELIQEYTVGKQDLKRRADRLDRSNPIEMQDLKQINSMIESMTFSLDWMKTGRQPGNYRGVDKKAIYQRRSYENIDLIPDIAAQLETDDINKKHLFMTREEKIILADILASFSLRERQCYILHVAQKRSMGDIATELGVSKSMVQQSIRRAKKKIKDRVENDSMIYA
ncbi:sigma factor-like helix-turn-helix DNA-binding protein [Sporosarcina saromensis]|uniref:Sigma factor-like helix-turn-helix DNA-binding protein n=1 Tax=Sporosarcina saromensis TaxID=359365 RepID=A0ABU4G9W9_9BACL|nr:sigma factor-like helix-turn-helix DNA-binding protein [Sporosarcina saromensis]MDW0113779.1 sigma factor-like helix-turn-helix DNA-binding protein [Sporosarcina saromensis]